MVAGTVGTSVLRRPRRGARAESDVSLDDPSSGLAIAECLRVKGFCVIGEALDEMIRRESLAAIEADAMEFYQPAVLVQEGLLGMEGSNRIARLDSGEGAASAALLAVDDAMRRLADIVGPYQEEIAPFRCTTRSRCFFHEASEPSIEETDLTDREANDWCVNFMSRKIMMFIALGPDRGTLELTPYDEDANPTDLVMFPGMAAIVRTDQMSFEYSTRGNKATYSATSFMLQGDILGMHPNKARQHMIPAARELNAWIESRLKEIKETQEDEPDWDQLEVDVPRCFISAANRTYFTKTQTAVRGFAARQPSCWEPEVFFLAQTTGCDVVTEVPFCRWDHSDIYDPAPESYKLPQAKTNCRHASFCEGIELFDNKMFSLSVAETKGMDPSQRQVLECTYESLFRSGMRKNTLTNSTCGMYVGMSQSDWNYAERSADVGIFGATGGAPSICAGRLSFCLGCRGASLAVDTEAASGLSALFWAAESVEKKGLGFVQELACGIGVHLIIAKMWWPVHSANGFLSRTGRCQTFDASADGYVRNEATASGVVRAKPETIVDGEQVKDDLPLVGTICGGATMSSGRSAGMSAPSSATEQAILLESCRKSGIMPYDVDVVECHGTGKLIADAVEVSSCGRALRGGTKEEMLSLCSGKSNVGNGMESGGLVSLSKMLHTIRWGIVVPNLHLRQINPHLDLETAPLLLSDETLEPRQQAIFAGVSANGFGGTHVHVQCFGGVSEDLRPPPEPTPEELRPRLTYWPGGGGALDSANRPRKGFYIAGTWNSWEPEPMKDEGEGIHGLVITMGENAWEQFQLLIDGTWSKVLHPHHYKAGKGTEVVGPTEFDEVNRSKTWLIDSRGPSAPSAVDALAVAEPGAEEERQPLAVPGAALGGADAGRPGDRYHVRLHVAGKWRTITWSKLQVETEAALVAAPAGRYYVAGDFNDWAFEMMAPDPEKPGVFSFEAKSGMLGSSFQIVRNKDWTQTFCPLEPHAGPDSAIHGPDDRYDGYNWHIHGKVGEVYKIQFQRTVDGDTDVRKVSWSLLSPTS